MHKGTHTSMSEKIQKLLDQINRDFPDGCTGIDCDDCPLNLSASGDVGTDLCDLLESMCKYRPIND